MHEELRRLLIDQAREADNIVDAEVRTLMDIQSPTKIVLDRDELMPLREIVAAMLGLNASSRYVYHGWASTYGQHVKDETARSLLALLVKRTNLLARELREGATDLKPTDRVRVDRALDFASSRGWMLSAVLNDPAPEPASKTSPSAPRDTTAPAANSPMFSMPRSVLIERHEAAWPTIRADLGEASKTGLAVAKFGARGWDQEKALEWARAKGKLLESDAAVPFTNAAVTHLWPSTVNRIKR